MKTVRIERLLASTAFGLALALISHAGMAQQSELKSEVVAAVPDSNAATADKPADIVQPEPNAEKANPAPDTANEAPKAEPKADPAAEPKQEVVAPVPGTDKAKAATAPEPAPVVARSPASEALKQLIDSKRLDRIIARKDDREGVQAFYGTRDYKLLWVQDGAASARAKAVTAYLAQVDSVGLDPRDYTSPDFAAALTPEGQAEAELRMTATVLTYARHAEIGRMHFTRVASDISFKLEAPEPAAVLAKVADATDVAAALDSYNPPQPEFKALRAALAKLRANDGELAKPEKKPELVRVPEGRILRPGMKDPRVVALRKRLNIAGDKENTAYDDSVVEAVKAFQMQADIGVDGMLGPQTVATLNGENATHKLPGNPIDTIMVNMERWRWLPRKLGNADNTYVVVNVPDFTLHLMHQGKEYWKTRIVVGKPSNMTPMTSAEMKYITVNPTWNVPPSIIENEYLPALQADPMALERIGLKIYQTPDGTVRVYQPPGAGNALGRIRFNFPNKFLVYQHDTPDKYLFKREKRAYSHGCMRVQDPLDYAAKLLSIELPQENYTKAKLESMYGSSEININFPKPIPVHLTYQTAFVDEDGKLQFREDVYGRDRRMIEIMKGNEWRVADVAIERRPDTSAAPVRLPPGTYGSYSEGGGYSGGYSGPNFFEMLFGVPPRQRYRPRGDIRRPSNNNYGSYYSRR